MGQNKRYSYRKQQTIIFLILFSSKYIRLYNLDENLNLKYGKLNIEFPDQVYHTRKTPHTSRDGRLINVR